MQSVFRYPGGKTRSGVRNRILRLAPPHTEYREPFVGGGGIFFSQPVTTKRWINDLDHDLISVYTALRDRPDDFIARCKKVPPFKSEEDVSRLKAIFDDISMDDTFPDQAFRYFFVNRTVWGGRVNYTKKSRVYFSTPQRWSAKVLSTLWEAASLMGGVRITCGDYEPLLTEAGDNVWIYADPPYYKPKLTSTSLLYRHNFEKNEQHERFAAICRACPHKLCISYEDIGDGYVQSLFKGFSILEEEWVYGGTQGKKRRVGKELLILNYEPK